MDLKLKTARALKWNTVDRVSTQVLYALVGVVLANILSPEEFGLVGALAIFQAFAIIFVDSGFGAALLREKEPDQKDYSTVFWFNLGVSVTIYVVLFFAAPFIARLFGNTSVLEGMSKVMFLTFVINGLAIVQTNRLMKQMDVRMIAISNSVALIVSGLIGIILAFEGYGAWAMVWYAVSQAAVKTTILWVTGGWWPSFCFSGESMRKIRRVGMSVFSSTLLNTVAQNLYNFVIGVWYGLAPLGIYTQADKYSKMGTASISQILTSSFVPLLAKVQDSRDDFNRYMDKTGRFTAFILLPAMMLLALTATPLFHFLFANKWNSAILLFRLLCIRGIFIVLASLYTNYLLAMGKTRHLIATEVVKDVLLFAAILCTIGFHSVEALVWGLLISSIVGWVIQVGLTAHGLPSCGIKDILKPLGCFIVPTLIMTLIGILSEWLLTVLLPEATSATTLRINSLSVLATTSLLSLGAYLYICHLRKIPELNEALSYLTGRMQNNG